MITVQIPEWIVWIFIAYVVVAVPMDMYRTWLKYRMYKLEKGFSDRNMLQRGK